MDWQEIIEKAELNPGTKNQKSVRSKSAERQQSYVEYLARTSRKGMKFVQCPGCASAYSASCFCCREGGYWVPEEW